MGSRNWRGLGNWTAIPTWLAEIAGRDGAAHTGRTVMTNGDAKHGTPPKGKAPGGSPRGRPLRIGIRSLEAMNRPLLVMAARPGHRARHNAGSGGRSASGRASPMRRGGKI